MAGSQEREERMKITAIETQARRPTRRNIAVDGRFALAVDEALVLEYGLLVGQEVTPADLEKWRAADEFQRLLENALNFLTFRPRSREEMRRHMQGQRVPPEVVERVLAKLEEMRLLNDQQFASFWVENREEFNPRSARALGAELRKRGVDRETIEATVAPERDEERALAAARKKMHSFSAADYQTFRNRLGPFLLRRGFNYSVTNAVIRQLWEALHQEHPPEDEGEFAEDGL
jgi:regulatory protein